MSDRKNTTPFDPFAILGALERRRVPYVLVGSLARVVHGTDEIAERVEICPRLRPDDMVRLGRALDDLKATGDRAPLGGASADASFVTPAGVLAIERRPAGSAGYEDLRRRATREPIGQGIRVTVPDPSDLARIASASDSAEFSVAIAVLRRLGELERSQGSLLERRSSTSR